MIGRLMAWQRATMRLQGDSRVWRQDGRRVSGKMVARRHAGICTAPDDGKQNSMPMRGVISFTDLCVAAPLLPAPSRRPNVAMKSMTFLLYPRGNAQRWQTKRQCHHHMLMHAPYDSYASIASATSVQVRADVCDVLCAAFDSKS